MSKFYQGRYQPRNPEKYQGDVNDIVYRSSYELGAFKWLDLNDDVKSWSSESVVIPYRCRTDGRKHRYFVDLKITFKNNKTILVEIKPEQQVKKPEKKKRTSQKQIQEGLNYAKNLSKWEAAQEFCEERGWSFHIWTEKALKSMGIKIL